MKENEINPSHRVDSNSTVIIASEKEPGGSPATEDYVSPITEKTKSTNQDEKFPLVIFPPRIRSIIETLADERLYPKDYVASAILFAVSVLIGAGSCLITSLGKIFANIYVAVIGDQGANKSTPIEWAISPLLKADHEAITQFKKAVEEWQDKEQEYRRTGAETDKPGPFPKCPRMMCNDVTPEVLLTMLAANQMGCGQYHDELSRLFGAVDRYNYGSNEDLYLSLYSGKPITVDRATKKDIISVLRPYFSMIGTIQPQRYVKLMAKKDRMSSGLFARVLEVNHFENPALLWNFEEDLPSDVDNQYLGFIDALMSRRDTTSHTTPTEYKFDPNTTAAFTIQSWQNDHEERIEKIGRDTDRAVFRKIQMYALKFALIIQVMWDVEKGRDNSSHYISFESAVYATILADYFYHNAKELARSLDRPTLSHTEENLFKALPNSFYTTEGRDIAKRYGLGKTCFHNFINKVKGTLIEQPSHGYYRKLYPEKNIDIFSKQ